MGIPSSPKNGGVDSGVTYVAFPRSTGGWTREWADVQAQVAALFSAWGGAAAVARRRHRFRWPFRSTRARQ